MRVCATDLVRLSRLDATLPVDFFLAVYLPCDFAGERLASSKLKAADCGAHPCGKREKQYARHDPCRELTRSSRGR